MNQSINTDSKNSKEPQQKYRLGTVSIKPEPATPWFEVGSANRSATRTLHGKKTQMTL